MEPEDLRKEIQLVKNKTDRPFGIDILFAKIKGEDSTSQGYTQSVVEYIEVIFEEGANVIVSGLGNPGRIVRRAHADDMKVMSLAGTSHQAKKVAVSGVDVVIASGSDCGGHVGHVGTMSLIPKIVDCVDVLAIG